MVGPGDEISNLNNSKTAASNPVIFASLRVLVEYYMSANFSKILPTPKGAKWGQRSNFGL
jgi:hypothetical protein